MPSKIITENKTKELSPMIEEMVMADIKTVMEIESKSFDDPWRKKSSFVKYAEDGNAFIVRNTQSVIVGYILIKRMDNTIKICKMAVGSDHRRNGFGKLIINHVKKLANDQAIKRLTLHVRASNYNAIDFYKNTGFKEIRKIENYYKKTGSKPEEKAAIEMQWVCSK